VKIVVLDLDHGHNLKIIASFGADPKTKIVVCKEHDELLNILNGHPQEELKKQKLEKSLVDGYVLRTKTLDGISRLTATLGEKRAILENLSPENANQKPLLNAEVVELEGQIAKSQEFMKKLEPALATRSKEIEQHVKTLVKDEDKKVDLIMVDRSFLGNLPSNWVTQLRETTTLPANQAVPIATMGYNENIDYIKQTLTGGVSDYFIKPVDTLLLKHGVARLTGIKNDEGKVFELKSKTTIKILKVANVTKMSEFEIELQSDAPFGEKELVELQTDFFNAAPASAGSPPPGRLLAQCRQCAPDPVTKNMYLSGFTFVGLTPHLMYELRKWLRTQYVTGKKEE
jgi:hypothetical protein